jgi:hypothetical protein
MENGRKEKFTLGFCKVKNKRIIKSKRYKLGEID